MILKDKLKEMGLELPEPPPPGGKYVSVNIRNNIAYLAIQFPKLNGSMLYQGKLGENLNTSDGYKAFQLCALNVLAHIDKNPGLERLAGLNQMDAYYCCTPEWDEAPKAVDGASELFLNILGDMGVHSRAIFGVEKLPRNFSVGITVSFSLKS